MPRRHAVIASVIATLTLIAGCGKASPTATLLPPSATPARPTETTVPATAAPLPTKVTLTPSPIPVSPTATATPLPTAVPATDLPPTDTPAPTARTSSPVPPANPSLGDTWARPTDGMVMVYVPGGTFKMGSDGNDPDARDDEFPEHTVTLDGFWIDQTEVNNAQFAAFLNDHGNTTDRGAQAVELNRGYCQIRLEDGAYRVAKATDRPVVMVTWYGADQYCKWVGGRLPTEAEWEYAARGPGGYRYPWGDDPPACDFARYGDCPRSPTQVGSLPDGASWCGAFDMAGNVWEWVADWFGRYPATPQENPTGPTSGSFRVQRGGGWHSPQWQVRATYRQHDTPPTLYNG